MAMHGCDKRRRQCHTPTTSNAGLLPALSRALVPEPLPTPLHGLAVYQDYLQFLFGLSCVSSADVASAAEDRCCSVGLCS